MYNIIYCYIKDSTHTIVYSIIHCYIKDSTHTIVYTIIHCYIYIKTHSRVSVAKKAVWYTSMLFTETTNSPFSTPHKSITTGPISIKFTYFMPSIYATLHTKFERNRPSSLRDMCSQKLPHFLYIFLLCTVLQK